jgi:glycolate oxidase
MKIVQVATTGKKVHIPEKLTKQEQIYEELASIVGNKYVEDDIGVLYVYSKDMTELDQYLPNLIVMPKTTEEVSEILKLANKYKVPVQCQVKGLNMGGVHAPLAGGIMIDLRRMNRILEIDEEAEYALVEAGVTWADLRKELQEKHPNFRLSYPFAPAQTGVVSNALLGGHLRFSTKYGPPSDQILSAEVVLPTGEIAYVGSRGLVKAWDHRQDLPDLLGLFIAWHGTTGIVTKASIRIIPKPKYEEKIVFGTKNVETTCELPRRLARTHSFDAVSVIDWRYLMVAMKKCSDIPITGPPDDIPEGIHTVIYSSFESEEELASKRKIAKSLAEKYDAQIMPPEVFDVEFRRQADAIDGCPVLGAPGGVGMCFSGAGKGAGLSWIGGLGPDKYIKNLWVKTREIFAKYQKIFPQLVVHEMCWGHIGCFREIVSFDVCDPEQVEQVRKAHEEEVRLLLDHGYVIYKPPKFATDIIINEYMDKGFYQLMKKIRETLDPNHIMAPGRWELHEE